MTSDGRQSELGERYAVKIWVKQGDPFHYYEEHWFAEPPDRELLVLLFDGAKKTFQALYPDEVPDDFAVNVERLRPADDFRPNFRNLVDEY